MAEFLKHQSVDTPIKTKRRASMDEIDLIPIET